MPSPNLLRTWAPFVALALAALATAQDQPKVTLTQPATKASIVLQQISKLTGVYLAADPIVGNIPVLVSVTDAPLDQLLQRIADATGGSLKTENDGYRLVNDNEQRMAEQAKERGWTIEAFERAKKKALETATGTGRWDQKTLDELVAKAQARREQLQNRINSANRGGNPGQITIYDSGAYSLTPANGAATRALSLLPASVLAGIGPGDRVVYSSSPNRMQQRIPFNVTQIVNDFVYNHNMLAKRAPDLKPPSNVNLIGALTSGDPIQGVAETHLILSRGYRSSTINVEIKFADQNGLYVGQGSTSVTPDFGTVGGATSNEGKVIELSEVSRQMAVIMAQEVAAPTADRSFFRVAQRGGGNISLVTVASGSDSLPKQFPDELLQVFTNPDKFDPASLYVSDAFIQAAKASGKNLVASFPDTIVRDLARLLVRGNVTTDSVLAASPAYGLTIDKTGDWMYVTPTWANAARTTRFDRDQAAKFFRAVNSRGFATLEERADYSFYVTVGTPDRPLDMVFLGLINKDVGDQLSQDVAMNLDLLRLYGTVPDAAKKQSGDKFAIKYGQLGGAGKKLAEHSYYSRASGMMMLGGQGQQISMMMMTSDTGPDGRSMPPANSIMNEPTEALPNGIPFEANVVISRTLQDGVYASTKGLRLGQLLTADELGMRQGMLDANFNGGTDQVPQYDTYTPAQVLSVEISLELGEFGRPSADFKDGWLLNNAHAMSYAQLPDSFRLKVEEAKRRFGAPAQTLAPIRRDGRGGGGGG